MDKFMLFYFSNQSQPLIRTWTRSQMSSDYLQTTKDKFQQRQARLHMDESNFSVDNMCIFYFEDVALLPSYTMNAWKPFRRKLNGRCPFDLEPRFGT